MFLGIMRARCKGTHIGMRLHCLRNSKARLVRGDEVGEMVSVQILPSKHWKELGFYRKSIWKLLDNFKQSGVEVTGQFQAEWRDLIYFEKE